MTGMSEPAPGTARARLLELAGERNVSLASLSDLLGRNASYLQQFIRKGSPRKLEEGDRGKLAEFLGVPESELIDRENGSEEKSYKRPQMRIVASGSDDYVDIPRLALSASAGPGAFDAREGVFDAFRFSRHWLAEQGLEDAKLSAIRVEGDSMEPLLKNGDEILVDTAPRPFRDGVHVVRLDGTLMVKRVANAGAGRFSLLSQNLAYPPVGVKAGELEIVGRVVWKGGRV